MDKVPEDKAKGLPTPIWTEYQVIVDNAENNQVCILIILFLFIGMFIQYYYYTTRQKPSSYY